MFKVLIIDDEPIIRKGLRNIINWKSYDCEVCGEASDGYEGSRLIREYLPDIVVTDIRMPEVDGLAMIRKTREMVPDCKIIILTGYRDFEYVQEAIKLGAFDFILKPSRVGELSAVIGRAVKELKAQREKLEEMEKLKKHFERNIPILREKVLYEIFHEINTNENDVVEKMEMLNMRIGRYLLVVAEGESDIEEETSQYDRHLYQYGIINTFDETFSDSYELTGIPVNNKQVAILLQYSPAIGYDVETIKQKCLHIAEIIKNCFGSMVSIAISTAGQGAMDLPKKLRECQEVLQYRLYLGNTPVLHYSDMTNLSHHEDYTVLEKYQRALVDLVRTGNEGAVRNKLNDISLFINGLESVDASYLKTFYWNTIVAINGVRMTVMTADSDAKSTGGDLTSLQRMIDECQNIHDLNDILSEIALKVTSRVNNFNKKTLKLGLQKAIDYIHEHYSEQMTLNEVSKNIFISSYYISRLFKKELGKNFVDYLNEVRISKAKELLKDVKYKTYEVAEMVGIPDAHYFSKLFKKYEGVTPTEYRDSKRYA